MFQTKAERVINSSISEADLTITDTSEGDMKGGMINALQVTASIAARDGGPSTAITSMNSALRQLGSKSLILSTVADGGGFLEFQTSSATTHMGTAVWFCKRNRPFSLKNSWSLGIRTIRLANRADIIHVHGIYLANSIYAYLASILTDTPYVIQPHGTLEPYQQRKGRLRKAVFNRLIGHRIINNCSGIISASSSEAENVQSQYPKVTAHVIPLGVKGETAVRPDTPPGHLDAWLSVPMEQRVIFLGRLATKKRPDLLIKAWAKVQAPGQLLFAGPDQDWDEASLRALVTPAANKSISFLPALDRGEVAWALTSAGAFALPSENENFAIAVAEAMHYGCAILSTKETAATEHVKAASCGIVLDLTNPNSLVEGINILLTDVERANGYRANAASYAKDKLTWLATARRLQVVYRSITDPKAHTGLTR